MNRRLLIFISLLFLLIAGGALTSVLLAEGGEALIPGLLETTEVAEGSVNRFGQGQGFWLFVVIGAIVFNLVGAAVTGAAIFWFLNREIERAKAAEPAEYDTFREALPGRGRGRAVGELPAEGSS